jgi:hypothetical protein
MINFIFWPVASFFDRRLYARLGRSSFATGFLYLAYLALILAAVFTAVITVRIRPDLNEFVTWWRASFPGIRITPQGFETDVKEPYEVVHPRWGTILIIDTGRTEDPSLKEMLKTRIYVTKTKAVTWNFNKTRLRVFDFEIGRKFVQNWGRDDFTLTGEGLMQFYENKFALLVALIFILLFGLLFAWKIYAAFFYSLIALALGRLSPSRFWYPGLFCVSCLALTPVAVLQILQVLGNFRFLNSLWASAITAGFLTFALAGGSADGGERA